MKTLKKSLALVLAFVMAFSLMSVASAMNYESYTDADEVGEAYAEAVDVMMGLKVINGMNATELGATETLTREQAAKIVAYLVLGATAADALAADAAPFTDVAADRWSAGYIAFCAENDILDGYGDGTFGPANELTGYQFAKMLLCALGYGKAAEYTGNGWAIKVAQDALPMGIFEGDLAAATNEPIQRQQAMLMAFNIWNVGTVKYLDTLKIYSADDPSLFAFAGLAQVANGEDSYGRPTSVWEKGTKKIAEVAIAPVGTYVNSFTTDVVATLTKAGYTGFDAAEIVYNGGNAGLALADLQLGKTAVNGYTVELYDANGDKAIETIVVTEGYFATIGKTTAAKGNTPASLVVNVVEEGASTTITVTDDPEKTDLFDTLAAYDEKDAIMVYCVPGWNTEKTGASILDVEDVTAVAGQISKVNVGAYNCTTTVVINGVTYELNNECVGGKALAAGAKGTLYLDAQGNGIGWVGEVVTVETNYAYVLDIKNNVATSTFGAPVDMIQLLLADGSVVEAKYIVKGKTDGADLASGTEAVKYSVADGVYTVEAVTTTDTITAITKNTATLAAGIYADSKTIFVVSDGKTPATYTAYTGIANVPTLTSVTAEAIVVNYHADIVFVTASTTPAATAEKAIFVTSTGAQTIKELAADGKTEITYYLQNAVVDGSITTIKTQSLMNGVYSSITTNANGIVTSGVGADVSSISSKVAYVNGVLNIDGGYKGYTSDAVCYIADSTTGVITVGTISELSADDTYTGSYTVKDGIVTGLYLIG